MAEGRARQGGDILPCSDPEGKISVDAAQNYDRIWLESEVRSLEIDFRFPPKADVSPNLADFRFDLKPTFVCAKEFASVRSADAPHLPNSKSVYGQLLRTRFGRRECRRQLRVFIATQTGVAIIEVNPR